MSYHPEQPSSEAAESLERIRAGVEYPLMGRVVVDAVNANTALGMVPEEVSPDDPKGHAKLLDEIDESRVNLAATQQGYFSQVGEYQVATLERLVKEGDPPQFLLDAFSASSAQELLERVLATPVNKETGRRVMNFFEWQAAKHIEREAEFETKELPALASATVDYFEQGEKDDTLPAGTADKWRSLYQSGKLVIAESLWTDLQSSPDHQRNADTSFMQDGSVRILLSLAHRPGIHTFGHESLHAISGKDGEDLENGGKKYTRLGLMRVFGTGPLGTELNEAVTETAIDSVIHGQADIVDPFDAARKHSRTYLYGRYLQNVLCYGGLEIIPPQLFTAAMLEEDASGPDSKSDELILQLERSFPGMNVVERIRTHKPLGTHEGSDPLYSDTLVLAEMIAKEAASLVPSGAAAMARSA